MSDEDEQTETLGETDDGTEDQTDPAEATETAADAPESQTDEVRKPEESAPDTSQDLLATVAANARAWGTLTLSYAARDVVFEDIPGNAAMQILTALRHPHIQLEDPLGLFAPAEARWMLVDRRIMGADWRPGERRYPPPEQPVAPALAAFDPPAEPVKAR